MGLDGEYHDQRGQKRNERRSQAILNAALSAACTAICKGAPDMALVKCRECGAEISSDAQACPRCGKSAPKKTSGCAMAVAAVLGIGILGSIVEKCSSSPESTASSTGPTASSPGPHTISAFETKEESLHKVDVFLQALRDMRPDAITSGSVSAPDGTHLVLDVFNAVAAVLQNLNRMQLTPDEQKKVTSLRAELVKRQVTVFPMLRKTITSFMGKELWKADVTVQIFGPRDTTIEFVGGDFAAHRNIQTAQEAIQPLLVKLRFRKAQYKWVPSAEETWAYKLDSPPDSAVAKIDEMGNVTMVESASEAGRK